MKKILLSAAVAIALTAQAQIPTNGLTDHWKLNGNLQNDVSSRPFLRNEGFHTCANNSGVTTIHARYADTLNFIADKNSSVNAAYWSRNKGFPDSVFCSYVPPSGGWLLFPASTGLETSTKYQFGNSERTFALWAKANRLAGSHRLFFTGEQTAKKAFGLDIKPGTNTVTLFTWGGGANDVNATVNDQDTLWHHYAATYDGAALKLYIDGVFIDSSAISNLSTSQDWIFFGSTGQQSDVRLDDILLYSRALSAAEIAQVFSGTQTAISELKPNEIALNIYPNPAFDILTIEAGEIISAISVTDLAGRTIVQQAEIDNAQSKIDVSALAQSTYFIRIVAANGKTATRTFVKQ